MIELLQMILEVDILKHMLNWGKVRKIIVSSLPFLAIFLFVVIPLGWFKKGLVIASGDNYFYLDPSMMFPSFVYSWYERIQAGFPNQSIPQIFPFMTFWWFFKAIGFSLVNIQRLWICSYFLLSGWSIYLIVNHIGNKINFKNKFSLMMGGVLSAALYMANVFVVIDLVQPSLRPVQAVLPLMLYLWIKGLDTLSFKYAFFLSLASLLYASANINLPTTAIVYLVLAVYLFFFLIFNKGKKLPVLKFVSINCLLFTLFNFWWFSSVAFSLLGVSSGLITALASYNFLKATTLQEAFRFMGFWAWKTTYEGVELVPYAYKYDQLPIVLFTYLIPVFSFLIFLRKKSKEVIFLGVLTLFGLFLVKGIQPPFGKIFLFLFNHVPGFLVFREPFAKFTLINVFSVSLLFGLSFAFVTEGLLLKRTKIIRFAGGVGIAVALFFFLFFVVLKNAFPLLTNEAIWDKHHKVARSLFVKVPGYWREAREWFIQNDQNDERIMILPKSGYGHDYDWESGISTAGPVAHVLQPKPIIFYSSTPTFPSEDAIRSLYDGLGKEKNQNFIAGLSMLNVRYLLQHNDLDWQDQLLGLTFSPQEVKEIMSQYSEISKVNSFGRLDVYELKDDFRKKKFFSASQVIYSQVKTADLLKSHLPLSLADSLVFEENSLVSEQRKLIVDNSKYLVLEAPKNKENKYFVFSPLSLNYDVYNSDKFLGRVSLVAGENVFSNDYSGEKLFLFGVKENNFQLPKIDFKKFSPVKYEININSSQPFFLVFSESFDPQWQAYVDGVKIPKVQHFMANGFANSWFIDKTGESKIEVTFSRQKMLGFSYLISVFSILVCLFYLIFKRKKESTKEEIKNSGNILPQNSKRNPNKFLLFGKDHWPLIIIFILGLLPLIWFKEGLIVAGGDNFIYLDPSANFFDNLYSWFGKMDAGKPNITKPMIFPFMFFWLFLKQVGFSLINIQRLWVILTFMLPGVSMFFLIKYCLRESKNGVAASLIGAVLYMFNPFIMTDIFQVALRPVLCFFPLVLIFWIKGLEDSHFSLKYPSLIALTSLFYASSNINLATVSPVYFLLFLYLAYFLVCTRRIKHALLIMVTTVIAVVFVNLWWLTDSFFAMVMGSKDIVTFLRSANFLDRTWLYETFRFMGFWAFRLNFQDRVPLVPYASSYYKGSLVITTYLIPILAFSSLIFKKNRFSVFFALTGLAGIFLAKGINPPFGEIYKYFFDKIPGFSVFREPFAKFTLIHVLSLSALIAFFTEGFYSWVRGKISGWSEINFFLVKTGLIMALLILILRNSFPLLTGFHIQSYDWFKDSRYSLFVKVPEYWWQVGKWFKENDPNSRVLLTPRTRYGQTYNWQSGMTTGDPVARMFLPNPIIRYPGPGVVFSRQDALSEAMYNQLMSLDPKKDLLPLFDIFAVDYILQQNDILPEKESGVLDPKTMRNYLRNQTNLNFLKTFSEEGTLLTKEDLTQRSVDVYRVSRKGPAPIIYQAKEIIYVLSDLSEFPEIFSFFKYQPGQLFLIPQRIVGAEQIIPQSSKIILNLKTTSLIKNQSLNFEIIRPGNYELFLGKNSGTESINPKKAIFSLNGKQISFNSRSIVKDWFKLGFLDKGIHSLVLSENGSFWLVSEDFGLSESFGQDSEFSYIKINPSKYKINFQNNDKFFLIFNESYDEKWKIYYQGKPVSTTHFVANGYANGWKIDGQVFNKTGPNYLTIEYEPQRLSDHSLRLSIFFASLMIAYLIFQGLIKRKFSRKYDDR